MRKIYRKIAKEYGITMQEVKTEMQSAINAAYQNNPDGVDRIPRKEKIPTPEEVIRYVASEVKKNSKRGTIASKNRMFDIFTTQKGR